jgi:signal transduction histidine kinase/CheY-like chemotaxis protein
MWDCPETPINEFAQNLQLIRPFVGIMKPEWLSELTDMSLHLSYSGKQDTTLRGQLFKYQEEWILVATPDVSSSAQLKKMGLKLTDLPFHNVSGDLLISNEANIISLKESQAQAKSLQNTLKQLQAVNRILSGFVPEEMLSTLDLPETENADATYHAEAVGRVIERLQQTLEFRQSFLANMSHELRTPLNAILGITEVILEGIYGGVTEKQVEMLGTVYQSGESLLSLINDILDLSKMDAGRAQIQTEKVPLREICDSAIALVKTQASRKGIKFESFFPDEVVNVNVDEKRIRDVLLNLLSNAIKFTAEGCVRIRLMVVEKSQTVRVSVQDTGVGIPRESFSQLFQPFVQLDNGYDRQHEGTGLGLAIAMRTAEMHEGTIEVKSVVGQGSLFTLVLPLVSGKPSAYEMNSVLETFDTPKDDRLELRERSKAINLPVDMNRILIVDDTETNRGYVKDYLSHLGYEVQIAANAIDGLDSINKRLPDLVLMDIYMPLMSGVDLIRCLRSMPRTENIPIIVFSASVTEDDKVRCSEAGADLFIDKPCELNTLAAYIFECFEKNGRR